VSKLEARIKRIERRVAIDEKPGPTPIDPRHYIKLQDPEGFRQKAMDPNCRLLSMRHAVDSPTPKKVIRLFRRVQMGLTTFPPQSSDHTREPAHTPSAPADPEVGTSNPIVDEPPI
jgi:hypothetical protein